MKYDGGYFDYEGENLPVFVKKNSLLPLAKPQNYVNDETVFELVLTVYGEKGECSLYDKNIGEVKICYENGELICSENFSDSRYRIKEIRVIK